MSNKELIDQLQTALEKSIDGYAEAIETAYKHGALDAHTDRLANPPEVLWGRSKLKKEMEKGE
jgi:hypothetical protein